MHSRRIRKSSFLFAWLLLLAGCYTVPETDRRSLNFYSEDYLRNAAAASFSGLKEQTPVSNDPTYNAMLKRVGTRIVTVARENPEYRNTLPPVEQWEFVVFDAPETYNAFAMPGGKVGVYTGMFNIVEQEDDLAVVVGHEIAHVAARHGNERLSQTTALTAIGIAVGVSVDSDNRLPILLAYGAGAGLATQAFSRSHENEADEIGLLWSAQAGYDPRRAINFWEAMGQASGAGGVPEFLSTHPSYDTRIRRLNELMPEALQRYEQARLRGFGSAY